MFRTDGKVILGVLLVLPTLLCFVGVGALLHLAVQAGAAERQEVHRRQEELEKDRRMAKELQAAIEDLECRIYQIRKKQAERKKAERCQAELSRLRARQQELQVQLSSLRSKLEDLGKRLHSGDADCKDLRRRVDGSRKKLDDLKREMEVLTPSTAGGDSSDEGPTIAELMGRIAEVQRALREQDRANELAEAEWQGIRQRGEGDVSIAVNRIHGTEQWQPPPDPLYVECDEKGIVLQPEDSRLPSNPSAVEQDRFIDVACRRGYVLFLIRPDGFESFRKYRSLIRGKVDFGYEPIHQHGTIVYPERN